MTKKQISSIYLIVLFYAVYLTLLGQLLPKIIDDYSLSMGGAGLFSTLQSIGGFVAVFTCIFVVDSFNKIKIFALCAIFLSVATLVIGLNPVIILLYVTFAVLGISTGFIDILSNVVIVDNAKEKNQRLFINLLHGLFSVGAVIGPLVAEAISSSFNWQTVFLAFAVTIFLCGMFYVYSFRQDVFKPLKAREIEKNIFKTPVVALKKKGMKSVALISIFTNFFLIGVMYWLSAYVSSIQGNHAHGALALSLFFIGIMVSRLGLSKLSTSMNRAKLVSAGAMLSSVFFVIGLFMRDPYVASICFLLCGVAMGAIFPQTVTMACNIAPESAGTASGIVFFGFIMGNCISPLSIGALADINVLGLKFALIGPAIINVVGGVTAYRIRKLVS